MSDVSPPAAGASGNGYKDTLNLPRTGFEMKANLVQREPGMVAGWREAGLYRQIRGRAHPRGKWVLHDGPPYANGDIHMGHLINKVLKDIVVKFRTMQGYDSPFVPGWDCHGLPIESAIQKELGPKFRELGKEELRKKCAEYAMKYVKLQGDSFQRLGVFGEFERPYLTLDPKYEGGILDVLAELVKGDLVYRQKKPVHWCVNDRTALAEAELEYASKKDTSVYVMFKMKLQQRDMFAGGAYTSTKQRRMVDVDPNDIYLMIWTTTPWTLPANRAVAIHPDQHYDLVQFFDANEKKLRNVVIGEKRVDAIMRQAGITEYETLCRTSGIEWLQAGSLASNRNQPEYFHPLDSSRLQPVVLADYVTDDDGTGLVHTAPGHGKEDYQTGMKYGLEVYNPVLSDGRYDESVPGLLPGKSIWDGNQLVIDELKNRGTLFYSQVFEHEYPHCWRCKKPVIFRATEQWFVDVGKPFKLANEPPLLRGYSIQNRSRREIPFDATGSKSEKQIIAMNQAGVLLATSEKSVASDERLAEIKADPALNAEYQFWSKKKVHFIPTWGANRLDGMLQTRPDWCVSRQRSWGVPIPAVFDSKGRCLLTEASVRRVAGYFREFGADSWYRDSAAKILGLDVQTHAQRGPCPTEHGTREGLRALGFPEDVDVATLEKGLDILDVWFESGASHHAVLECTHPELGYPANMYLEGSDQHRGWFQSSLLEASGYKSEPPFREVLTHGFIVDEKGRKMSKSEGNDIKVNDALKQYGADVLRLWVSSVDYQNDIACGPALLAKTGEAYRKIRNTIRYLLGNLYDFDAGRDAVEAGAHSIDAWMMGRAEAVFGAAYKAYDTYEFHGVFKNLYEFCNVEISAVYAKAIKDRLYCELPNSRRRRASQTVCYRLLLKLVELVAPVLVFTAEEAWAAVRALPGNEGLVGSVHLKTFEDLKFEISEETGGGQDARVTAHWGVLMPLIEEANRQLDELKKSVGGKFNTLDAEVVIVLPSVGDEVSAAIGEYGAEVEDALGVGFHRVEHGEVWGVRVHDVTGKYGSCARSWKRRPDVGSDAGYPDLSKRDAEVVRALRSV